MNDQDVKKFQVVFDCDARAVGKMRCEMDVRLTHPEKLHWEFASDEYGFHGGDGTAPLPIAYFMAGLTSCLMTQFRAFSKRLRVNVKDVNIYCECQWEATQVGREPYESSPKSIRMDMVVESDSTTEEITKVINAAKKGCFIEQMMNKQNNIEHRLKVGDEWINV